MYDLIIIGAGPAGITAGIYAARLKIKALLLTDSFGGQANDAWQIENYPGLPGLTGAQLIEKMVAHLKGLGIEIKEGKKITSIKKTSKGFSVGSFESKTIIIATGKRPKKIEAKNIEKFEKKGVSYCATCDAPLFKNKTVVVAGGGNHGINTSHQLLQYAKKIYLVEIAENLTGTDKATLEKFHSLDKVEILTQTKISKLEGEGLLSSVTLKNAKTGQEKKIPAQGLFVAIGSIPNSQIVKDLVKLNKEDEIVIDSKTNAASVPGIFAAGDVTDVPQKQIIVAAAEGAKAALGVYEFLKSNANKSE